MSGSGGGDGRLKFGMQWNINIDRRAVLAAGGKGGFINELLAARGGGFNSVELKNRLCDVKADCRDRLHD